MLIGSSQVGSIGRTTRQEIEAGQQEQENSGKKEAHSSAVLSQPQKKQDETASLRKVLSHVPNTDKNNRLIEEVRDNKKPDILGQ